VKASIQASFVKAFKRLDGA